VNCPYCGSPVDFCDSKRIYGKSYGMVYVCSKYPECRAWVMAHRNGGEPMGILANDELRTLRKYAHKLFDPLWQSGKMKRPIAYRLMRTLMDLPTSECHIGMMNEIRCKVFIGKILEYLKK
jgi:hypothetical protein